MTTTSQSRPSAPGNVRTLMLMAAALFLFLLCDRAGMQLLRGIPLRQLPASLTQPALVLSLAVLVFVPGFLLAERVATSRGRAGPYTLVVLVGCMLVAALAGFALDWLGFPRSGSRSLVPLEFGVFLFLLMRVGLAGFVYASHLERVEAAHAAQALESRRNEMLGHLAASRLEAARARVQPEAFIAELRALRKTYVEDPATGATVLEALITRLRAASQRPGS